MFRSTFISICTLTVTLSLTGCAVNQASATLTPGADLAQVKSAYVVKLPKDERGINDLISANLEKRGYAVTKGPELNGPYNADVAVTYIDKWMWDITMYMIELTINVRDPKTGFPMAVGKSLHTSLTRKSPPEMVEEVIDNILKAPKK
ncbi:MAG: hypothetical protein V4724_28095 [Pseudomonadota bacterium]